MERRAFLKTLASGLTTIQAGLWVGGSVLGEPTQRTKIQALAPAISLPFTQLPTEKYICGPRYRVQLDCPDPKNLEEAVVAAEKISLEIKMLQQHISEVLGKNIKIGTPVGSYDELAKKLAKNYEGFGGITIGRVIPGPTPDSIVLHASIPRPLENIEVNLTV